MKARLAIAAAAAIAALSATGSASADAGASVSNYGTCTTHLVAASGHDGQVISGIVRTIGPLTAVTTPTGAVVVAVPPGRAGGGLEACPVGSP